MAEQSGFFNSNLVNGEYDRVYLAEHFAKYFASFIGNGIFGGKSNELMVSESSTTGMKVEVLSGMGWINGYWYENTSNFSLSIATADGVLNRIDSIVLRWDKVLRSIRLVVKKGEFASIPYAPTVQRDTDIYELKLAEISVKAGTVSLTQADIKDTRLDSNVCGFVVAVVKQFDTTEFGKQLDSFISNYSTEYRNYIDGLKSGYTNHINALKENATDFIAEYKDFIEDIKLDGVEEFNKLLDRLNAIVEDENILATLALKVEDVASENALAVQTLGYSKKNLALYPYAETSKVENGITWTDNGDGTVKANGTAQEQAHFLFRQNQIFRPGKYILSAGLENTSTTTYFIYIEKVPKKGSVEHGNMLYGSYQNNGMFEITELDVENYDFYFSAVVAKGATVSNIVFKPMIRRAEILDDTWEPYRLSVSEMIQEDEIEKGCFYRYNRFTGVKEWINPPFKPGIEYCTTERWNGKPIYQKTFYVASLPVNSVMSIETNTQWDKVVSVSGYAHDSDDLTYFPFPVILHNQITPVAVISRVESEGSVVVATSGDISYMQAYITVRYTKS